nr:hypothetical protein [Ipomoea trifida]GMD46999.1 hypothetical protein [Ipomoea batatas]
MDLRRTHSYNQRSLAFEEWIYERLVDQGFIGQPFTWARGHIESKWKWAKRDRVLSNGEWSSIFSRPKWNGSLSYVAPQPESPRLLLSARSARNRISWLFQHNIRAVSFYADPGLGWLFGKPIPTALMA